MRLALTAILAACGTPPAHKPPPAELPVTTVGDVAGRWVASDDMDFGYAMTIDDKGGIDVWIDRGKLGRCEQKGTIEAAQSRSFRILYSIGECSPREVGIPVDMKVASFTGAALTVVVGNQSRTYVRAPMEEHGQPPAVQLQ